MYKFSLSTCPCVVWICNYVLFYSRCFNPTFIPAFTSVSASVFIFAPPHTHHVLEPRQKQVFPFFPWAFSVLSCIFHTGSRTTMHLTAWNLRVFIWALSKCWKECTGRSCVLAVGIYEPLTSCPFNNKWNKTTFVHLFSGVKLLGLDIL